MTQVRIRMRPAPGAAPSLVLWAEDNQHDQMLIEEAVRGDERVQVAFVSDGVHALDALRRERPALLVLDLRMPRLGGLDTLRHVRGEPSLRDLRVCVFSAGNQPDEVAACRALGVLDVVQKPVDFDTFERSVHQILAHAGPMAVA